MNDDDYEFAVKVVIVGNGVVGKSSMIQRYCRGVFTNEYKKTLGVDFLERYVRVRSEAVRLMLWDTAGQEEFDALTKAYYRGAQACAIVFSTTDRESFSSIESWKKKVEFECGEIPMVLVQNKIDLINESAVKREEVDNLARRLHLKLFKTSVRDNVNVDNVFQFLSEAYVNSLDEDLSDEPVSSSQYPNACLKPSLIATPSATHPLFNFGGQISKYRRKGAKCANNGYFHMGRGIPHSALGGANGNPFMNHFRYKSKFHIIPMRHQQHQPHQPHNPTTILLHHQYHPNTITHGYHTPITHQRESNKFLKNSLFKNCRIL